MMSFRHHVLAGSVPVCRIFTVTTRFLALAHKSLLFQEVEFCKSRLFFGARWKCLIIIHDSYVTKKINPVALELAILSAIEYKLHKFCFVNRNNLNICFFTKKKIAIAQLKRVRP